MAEEMKMMVNAIIEEMGKMEDRINTKLDEHFDKVDKHFGKWISNWSLCIMKLTHAN